MSSDRNLRVRGCNDDHIDVIGAHNERQQDCHKHGDSNGKNAGKWGGGRMTTRSGGVCHKVADDKDRDNDDRSKKNNQTANIRCWQEWGSGWSSQRTVVVAALNTPPLSDKVVETTTTS